MVSAAIRILLFVSFVFCGLSGSAGAGIKVDPADTLNSAVSAATSPTGPVSDATNSAGDVADGVTGTVNDAADNLGGTVDDVAGTVDDAAGTVNDVTGSVTGGTSSGGGGGGGGSGSSPIDSVTGSITGGLSGSNGSSSSGAGGTSSSSGVGGTSSSGGGSGSNSTSGRSSSSAGPGSTSNRGSARTRFDRLPRLYERLLERIESGVDVQASIARLRVLLATASPRLRTQILRLIRQEIRRLEKGGLTRHERAAVRRLTPLLKAFQASRLPERISPRDGTASFPLASSDGREQVAGAIPGPLLSSERAVSGGDEVERGNGVPSGPLFVLPSSPGPAYWLLVLLAAIAGALWLGTRAPRHVLPSAVRGMVEIRGAEIWALAATIGLIAVVGAGLLIQALFL